MHDSILHVKIKTKYAEAEGIMTQELFRAFISALCPDKLLDINVKTVYVIKKKEKESEGGEDAPF